jgi:multidrug efflux pump subunit AcrA (membrane-fusion protein)
VKRARELAAWLRRRPRLLAGLLAGALFLTTTAFLSRSQVDRALTTPVRRGDLQVSLQASGILKPAQSLTYRSPLQGRDAELVFLVPEGTRVNEGDLLARIDATDVKKELERAVQEQRQAQLDLQLAEVEKEAGAAAIDSLVEGEGSLGVLEARAHLQRAEKKVERLREEYQGLKPLLEKGFITRDELERSGSELEQAEADLLLQRRKSEILIDRTRPRDTQRARLQLAQKEGQAHAARARALETAAQVKALRETLENCSLYARAGGLVVHEEYLAANPRRKVRVGDRVTASQGIVTIPEVSRMTVEASLPEAEVHRLKPGQRAEIRLDAFPELRLSGKVARVGTLARASSERPWEEKRFDMLVEIDGSPAELRPEMTARVEVLVGEKKGVLLLPINAVFDRGGLLVAHVVHPFWVESRQVELGDSNDRLVELRAGLKEGERVALTDLRPTQGGAPSGEAAAKPMLRPGPEQRTPLAPR